MSVGFPWFRGRKSVPVVQQLELADCGAACLTMVLRYFGAEIPSDEVRARLRSGLGGNSAEDLVTAARSFGLRARGVQVDLDELHLLDPGSILHWEFKHFIVFERELPSAVQIVDPASGARRVSKERFGQSFTGVALVFEPGPDFVRRRSGEDRALARLKRRLFEHRKTVWRLLALAAVLQVFALSLPIVMRITFDHLIPRRDYHLFFVLGAGLLVFFGVQLVFALTRARMLLYLRTLLDRDLRLDFLDHLLALPYWFFQTRAAGDLLARLNSNALLRELLSGGVVMALLDVSTAGLYLLLLLVSNGPLTAVVLALAFVEFLVFWFSRRALSQLTAEFLELEARSESFHVELLTSIENLKAMGVEREIYQSSVKFYYEVLNATLAKGKREAYNESIVTVLRSLAPIAILGVGAYQVLEGGLSVGRMLELTAIAGAFLAPLSGIVSTAGMLQLLRSYLERIEDVMGTKPEQDVTQVRPAPRLTGDIELSDVSFSYGDGERLVIRDLSLRVKPGQFVAIVGKSGAGKSTLAHLMLGLYPPRTGRVLYDGTDLSELDLTTVRRQIGVVSQFPSLFAQSIRANIGLSSPEADLPAVIEAARLAQLHREIEAMPLGYDTVLADRGASLSGGQRQRLALARALLRRPAILLLDEATSSLDAVSEAAIHASVAGLRCTRIVIAHRLSTIMNADVILVLDDGRIVEHGTHPELLARAGAYAKLVAAQSTSRSHESRLTN